MKNLSAQKNIECSLILTFGVRNCCPCVPLHLQQKLKPIKNLNVMIITILLMVWLAIFIIEPKKTTEQQSEE